MRDFSISKEVAKKFTEKKAAVDPHSVISGYLSDRYGNDEPEEEPESDPNFLESLWHGATKTGWEGLKSGAVSAFEKLTRPDGGLIEWETSPEAQKGIDEFKKQAYEAATPEVKAQIDSEKADREQFKAERGGMDIESQFHRDLIRKSEGYARKSEEYAQQDDSGWAQFGAMLPQMVPVVASIAVPQLAPATLSGMGLVSFGSAAQSYRDYIQETGGQFDPLAETGVAVAAGAAEILAEKVGLGRYQSKLFGNLISKEVLTETGTKTVTDMFTSLVKSNPELGGKILGLVAKGGFQALEEGGEELLTEAANIAAEQLMYKHGNLSEGESILDRLYEAGKGGMMMGGVISPIGSMAQSIHRKKAENSGAIRQVATMKDGSTYEIFHTEDGGIVGVKPTTKLIGGINVPIEQEVNLKEEDIESVARFSAKKFKEFEQAVRKGQDVSLDIEREAEMNDVYAKMNGQFAAMTNEDGTITQATDDQGNVYYLKQGDLTNSDPTKIQVWYNPATGENAPVNAGLFANISIIAADKEQAAQVLNQSIEKAQYEIDARYNDLKTQRNNQQTSGQPVNDQAAPTATSVVPEMGQEFMYNGKKVRVVEASNPTKKITVQIVNEDDSEGGIVPISSDQYGSLIDPEAQAAPASPEQAQYPLTKDGQPDIDKMDDQQVFQFTSEKYGVERAVNITKREIAKVDADIQKLTAKLENASMKESLKLEAQLEALMTRKASLESLFASPEDAVQNAPQPIGDIDPSAEMNQMSEQEVSAPEVVAEETQSEPVEETSPAPEVVDPLTEEIASQEPNIDPTEAQKEAGNYKKAHVNVQGMEITIENPKGSVRSGVNKATGKAWETPMNNHYGYFKGTSGYDGDQIDAFIGDNPESDQIFVVDQINPETGEFDESKVMLGFNSAEEAHQAYMSNYEEGWQGFKAITPVSVADFKTWLYDGAKQRKSFSEYVGFKAQQVDTEVKQPSVVDPMLNVIREGQTEVAPELSLEELKKVMSEGTGSERKSEEIAEERKSVEWVNNAVAQLPASPISGESIENTIRTGSFGVLTGQNPNGNHVEDHLNGQVEPHVKKWLEDRKLKYYPVVGRYGAGENSFLVPNLTRAQAVEFAKEFNQESVVTNEGLIYQDGTVNPRVSENDSFEFDENDPNLENYSVVRTNDGTLKRFAVGLLDYDFNTHDEMIPTPEAQGIELTDETFRWLSQNNPSKHMLLSKMLAATKALQSKFPDCKVYVNQTADLYSQSIEEVSGQDGDYSTEGARVFSVKESGEPVAIHINLQRANDSTIAHEVFHPLVVAKIGTDTDALWEMVTLSREILSSTDFESLVRFSRLYRESGLNTMADEFLAELGGRVTSNLVQFRTRTYREKVIKAINSFTRKHFGMNLFSKNAKIEELRDFFELSAKAIREGGSLAGDGNMFTGSITGGLTSAAQLSPIDTSHIKWLLKDDVESRIKDGVKISTRTPKGKNQPSDVFTSDKYTISLKEARKSPDSYIKNALELSKYPIMGKVSEKDIKSMNDGLLSKGNGGSELLKNKALRVADKVYDKFVGVAADNLLWLHDNFDPTLAGIAKRWYDGANVIAQQLADKHNITLEQASGVIAVLSPQKDWFRNVSCAERVMDIYTNKLDFVITKEMADKYIELSAKGQQGKNETKEELKVRLEASVSKAKELMSKLVGKTISQSDEYSKLPEMIRVYDETYNDRFYDIVSPNGQVTGVSRNKNGSLSNIAWGSYGEIGKAVSIMRNGSVDNISQEMGDMHKVRNFFNNISNPNAKEGYVTIDTHAVAASLLMPLSGNSPQVLKNFAGAKALETGITGTYPAYVEAYNLAAEKRGLLPRQMQSITWEAVRGLFEADFKSEKLTSDVESIWNNFTNDNNKANETREQIKQIARGITLPVWARSSSEEIAGIGDGDYAEKLSNLGVGGLRRGARLGNYIIPNTFLDRRASENLAGTIEAAIEKDSLLPVNTSGLFTSKAQAQVGENVIPQDWEIDEDGEGNFVFYHYGKEIKGDSIDPKYFKKNSYTTDNRWTPISFFYTRSGDRERMVSGDRHIVKVPKEKVYPFNADPLNLYDKAKENFFKENPDYYPFTPIMQIEYMHPLINDLGYTMVVARWGAFPFRAESIVPHKFQKSGSTETSLAAENLTKIEKEIYSTLSVAAGKMSGAPIRSQFYAADGDVSLMMADPKVRKFVGKKTVEKYDAAVAEVNKQNTTTSKAQYSHKTLSDLQVRVANRAMSGMGRFVDIANKYRAPERIKLMATNVNGLISEMKENPSVGVLNMLLRESVSLLDTMPSTTAMSLADVRVLGSLRNDLVEVMDIVRYAAMPKQTIMPELIDNEIDVDGKMRPSRNSNGRLIHPTEEGVRNFWKWFGDSKAVDAQGKPIVLYHGTGSDFTEVKPNPITYFAEHANYASVFASYGGGAGVVFPVYLKIENPIDISDLDTTPMTGSQFLNELVDRGIDLAGDDIEYLYDYTDDNGADYMRAWVYVGQNRRAMKRIAAHNAKDGIIQIEDNTVYENGVPEKIKTKAFIVFDGHQVKSAIGNNGGFDPKELNMNAQLNVPDSNPIIYTGKFVNDPAALQEQFPTFFPNKYYHHTTMAFKPSSLYGVEVGNTDPIKAIGRLTTDKVDLLVVENEYSNNKIPHITLGTAEGVKPVASNKELELHATKIRWFDAPVEIPATEGYFDGKVVLESKAQRIDPLGGERIIGTGFKDLGDRLADLIAENIHSVDLMQQRMISDGLSIPEDFNVYKHLRLLAGRVRERQRAFNEGVFKNLETTIARLMDAHSMTQEDVTRYMKAKSSIERNDNEGVKAISEDASDPWSRKVVEQLIADFEAKVSAADVAKLWADTKKATDFSIDTLYAGHRISRNDYKKYKGRKYYIPLRSWEFDPSRPNPEDFYQYIMSEGKGLSEVRYLDAARKAKGRTSESQNPLGFIRNLAHSAIVTAEKNMANHDLLMIYRANIDNPIIDKYVRIKEKRVDATQVMRDRAAAAAHEVEVFENGDRYVLVTGDPHVAQSINGENILWKNASRILNNSWYGNFNRFIKANFTGKNPNFFVNNLLFLDLPLAMISEFVKAEGHFGDFTKTLFSGVPFSAIHRGITEKTNPLTQAEQNTVDLNSKAGIEAAEQQFGKSRIVDTLYQMWKDAGGATGWLQIDDIKKSERLIDREIGRIRSKEASFGKGTGKLTNRDKIFYNYPMRKAGELMEYVMAMSEEASRFTVFMERMANGSSLVDAAIASKEATVDFDRTGQIAKFFNGLYAFFKPAISGTYALYKMGSRNKGRMAGVLGSFFALGVLQAILGAIMFPPDDEGNSEYDNIPDYAKYNNLVINRFWDDATDTHVKIPLPQFFRAIYALGVMSVEFAQGKKSAGKLATEGLTNLFSATTPFNIDGDDPVRVGIPTAFVPFYDLGVNKDFTGRRIYKEQFTAEGERKTPHSQEGMRSTWAPLVEATQWLNEFGGGSENRRAGTGIDPETGLPKKGYYNDKFVDLNPYDHNPAKIQHVTEYYGGGRLKFFRQLVSVVSDAVSRTEDVKEWDIPIAYRYLGTSKEASPISGYYAAKNMVTLYKDEISAAKLEKNKAYQKELENLPFMSKLTELTNKAEKRIKDLKDRMEDAKTEAETEKWKAELTDEYVSYNKKVEELSQIYKVKINKD